MRFELETPSCSRCDGPTKWDEPIWVGIDTWLCEACVDPAQKEFMADIMAEGKTEEEALKEMDHWENTLTRQDPLVWVPPEIENGIWCSLNNLLGQMENSLPPSAFECTREDLRSRMRSVIGNVLSEWAAYVPYEKTVGQDWHDLQRSEIQGR